MSFQKIMIIITFVLALFLIILMSKGFNKSFSKTRNFLHRKSDDLDIDPETTSSTDEIDPELRKFG